MSDVKDSHLENISLFLAHLLKRLLLPVTMLKKIDFEDIAKCQKSIAFLRSLFKNICEICSTEGESLIFYIVIRFPNLGKKACGTHWVGTASL